MKRFILTAAVAAVAFIGSSGIAAAGEPTCSNVLDIQNHGQHVVADYVTGIGHPTSGWPITGAGKIVGANKGAVGPGGPGSGHLSAGVAPGASFCTGSNSPGLHP